MTTLADTLASLLGRPVVDFTGLHGEYDIALEMSPSEISGPATALFANSNAGEHTSLFVSITKLGLRLQARKLPISCLVVEQIKRVPSEN
jgi:uncharacterized protein (TIGR03435 family)